VHQRLIGYTIAAMKCAHAALLAVMFAIPAGAAPEWIKIKSPNFEIYTTSGERDGRNTLTLFEQVRDFFMRVKAENVTTHLPVTIVGFRNAKEFKPYQISEAAAAFYVGDEQRDYIVMGDLGAEHAPVAIHEYMHLLVRHSGLKMPIWLNEGFAEVYSTLKPLGGQILMGAAPPGRPHVLGSEKWLPLEKLMAVTHDSPEYNEKNRAGILYAQSWLLTHMLMLSADYKDLFPKFVLELHECGSAEKAFQTVYKRKIWEIETELRAYHRSDSLSGLLFKTRFEKVKLDPAEPAGAVDVEVTLAKLTALMRRYDEAKERFIRLAETHPNNANVHEALAHLYWRQGARELAAQHFGQAIQHGANSWKTYWDYARLLGAEADPKAYREALHKVVALRPDLLDARLALGSELMRQRMWGVAFVTLRDVKNIHPERAPELLLMLAHCALSLQKNDEAKKYVLEAQKWAKQPRHVDQIGKLIAYLDRPNTAPLAVAAVAASAEEDIDARPRLERHPETETTEETPEPPAPQYTRVRGNFKRLDCLGPLARMHVMDTRNTHVLLIRDPRSVRIHGKGVMDMTCGPQNLGVIVAFVEVKDEKHGTTGDVREIEILE
jgi:tetratricopeptide (TPR) repeat protein